LSGAGGRRPSHPGDSSTARVELPMGKRPQYRELEHTADVGIEFETPDVRSGFEVAAASMFDLMCDLDQVGETWRRDVSVKGREGDIENLMIRWLNELLYIFESERVLLSSFDVRLLEGDVLEATVAGEKIDRKRHAIKMEIKAPTYHDIRIERWHPGYRVRVIFDT
jgi:SHS2 domain-containing protein